MSGAAELKDAYTFDREGNALSHINPANIVTAYTYDPVGRQLSSSQPGLNENNAPATVTSIFSYDFMGNVLTEKDPLNRVTAYEYDKRGNLIKKTDAMGGISIYACDLEGRLTASKDIYKDASGNGGTMGNRAVPYNVLSKSTNEILTDQNTTNMPYSLIGAEDNKAPYRGLSGIIAPANQGGGRAQDYNYHKLVKPSDKAAIDAIKSQYGAKERLGAALVVVVFAGGVIVGGYLVAAGTTAVTTGAGASAGASLVAGSAGAATIGSEITVLDAVQAASMAHTAVQVVELAVDGINGGAAKVTTKNLDDLFSNPKAITKTTPEDFYKQLQDSGFNPQPLSDGSLKGMQFSDGGGYKVNWGGDKLLQYHPAGTGHHGGDAYWKMSSGLTGTMRYDLFGNPIK